MNKRVCGFREERFQKKKRIVAKRLLLFSVHVAARFAAERCVRVSVDAA